MSVRKNSSNLAEELTPRLMASPSSLKVKLSGVNKVKAMKALLEVKDLKHPFS